MDPTRQKVIIHLDPPPPLQKKNPKTLKHHIVGQPSYQNFVNDLKFGGLKHEMGERRGFCGGFRYRRKA
jgi:hypothetical protein